MYRLQLAKRCSVCVMCMCDTPRGTHDGAILATHIVCLAVNDPGTQINPLALIHGVWGDLYLQFIFIWSFFVLLFTYFKKQLVCSLQACNSSPSLICGLFLCVCVCTLSTFFFPLLLCTLIFHLNTFPDPNFTSISPHLSILH